MTTCHTAPIKDILVKLPASGRQRSGSIEIRGRMSALSPRDHVRPDWSLPHLLDRAQKPVPLELDDLHLPSHDELIRQGQSHRVSRLQRERERHWCTRIHLSQSDANVGRDVAVFRDADTHLSDGKSGAPDVDERQQNPSCDVPSIADVPMHDAHLHHQRGAGIERVKKRGDRDHQRGDSQPFHAAHTTHVTNQEH